MQIQCHAHTSAIYSGCILPPTSKTRPAGPQDNNRTLSYPGEFSIFAGAGFGAGKLDPDTSQVKGQDSDDQVSVDRQINLGIVPMVDMQV